MATFTVTDPNSGRKVTLTSQDNVPPTEQELEQIFAGSSGQQQPSENKYLSDAPIEEEKSPISLQERLFLGSVNDRDREKYLRSKYSNVQRLPNGKFAVGNDDRNIQPIDPEGIFNDTLGDLADVASEIPVIAGQIMGGTIGAATANAPGAIAGSAGGAAIGELGRTAIGKMSGIDERRASEIATDMAISGAFGAAGESLAIGTKALGQRVLAPKLVSIMNKISNNQAVASAVSPDETRFASATKRIFHYLGGVPEESTGTFFKYGFKEMSNPEHFAKKNILNIVDDTVSALKTTTEEFGQEVNKQTSKLVGLSKNNNIPTEALFKSLRDDAVGLGILDETYKINKLHPNAQEIKPVISLLREFGDVDNGVFIPNPNKKISVDKAIKLSRAYGQKFDNVSPNVQHSFYKVFNGDEASGIRGLRPTVTDIAESLGLKEYAEANAKYARLMSLKDRMRFLDTKNPGKIESFINRLETVGQVQRRDLQILDNMIGGNLTKRWELFNAAQDFTKATPDVLRFGSIAATLGVLSGFDSKESRLATVGGAMVLGTPAGIRMMIRLGNRIGRPMTKQQLQNIGKQVGKINQSQVSSALLSRLLNQKFNNTSGNKQESNKK